MAREGEPAVVAALYSSAVTSLYRADDLRSVVVVAQKGIDYCLMQASEAGKRKDKTLEELLRGLAKTIAYNLGSYTWPGWDEPGIKIQPEDLVLGFQAAKLNLRLGEDLARGAEPMSRAHWLVGAHALAAGNMQRHWRVFERQPNFRQRREIEPSNCSPRDSKRSQTSSTKHPTVRAKRS
jgi:hypothetical protein